MFRFWSKLYSSKSDALSSTSSRASNASSFASLAIADTLLLSNLAPAFAIGKLSESTTLAEITETTFAQVVEGSSGFSGKGISASLTLLRKALSVVSNNSISQGRDIVKGLGGGHGHEKETDCLKRGQVELQAKKFWDFKVYLRLSWRFRGSGYKSFT